MDRSRLAATVAMAQVTLAVQALGDEARAGDLRALADLQALAELLERRPA